MALGIKRENEIIPKYSLTGDLISFLRCGLQYRYHNGSSLPPSRPVQLWFGEFIHGVMESAYRIWRHNPIPFPWPVTPTQYRAAPPPDRLPHDIGTIGEIVEATLSAQGKNPRSAALRNSAYKRADKAVNELGKHLFPLIESAEERVIGTRDIPHNGKLTSRSRFYELHGIIDVLTNVQLTGVESSNVIRKAVQDVCSTTGDYEVIVDYKGTRRPAINDPYWQQGEWQVQTYSWLRTRQPGSKNIIAGVLIYINELAPGDSDIQKMQKERQENKTDVIPENGSLDFYKLNAWRKGNAVPDFSVDFLFKRAIRVIPVSRESQINATKEFDKVVLEIEKCVSAERNAGTIINHWNPGGDEETCVACDFRYFCPSPAPRNRDYHVLAPSAP
ncbi:MAG: PD-(D/E)XK nuclease family protein [Leptospiraceae bacterium]|nr:PD-(D/E)XK nuclease family protein [Leptospiraceae bacterium]MCP5494314.1 PD-(D/E)XK nuclease family protein [Leptospiraceae bacterium]